MGAMTVLTIEAPAAPPKTVLPLFDRELSWLGFNERVLGEAENPDVPLLERVKFLSICSHNLDEFFMIRVGEIRDLIAVNLADKEARREKLDAVRHRSFRLLDAMHACLGEMLQALKKEGVRIEKVADLGKKDRAAVEEFFVQSLEPILTPLAIDPGHPFPLLANLTLNLGLMMESDRGDIHAVVLKIPETMPRFLVLDGTRFVPVEDIVAAHAGRFFPGLKVRAAAPFRVIRNSDLSIKEEDVQDLLKTMESELRRRDRREVVWIEIEAGAPDPILKLIVQSTKIDSADVFFAPGPLKLGDLFQIYQAVDSPKLKDPPFNPRIPAQLATSEDIFAIIRRGDLLLHRPYDSFAAVVEFVQAASEDPDVVAIKQTLYRTDRGSPIIDALTQAASRGKQVTAVVAPLQRQLQRRDRPHLHGRRSLHLRPRLRRRRGAAHEPAHRFLRSRCAGADRGQGRATEVAALRGLADGVSALGRADDRPGSGERRGRQAGLDHGEAERAGRHDRHRRALSRQPGRREDRPLDPRNLLPRARCARRE